MNGLHWQMQCYTDHPTELGFCHEKKNEYLRRSKSLAVQIALVKESSLNINICFIR